MISLVNPIITSNFRRAQHLLGFFVLVYFLGCGHPKQYVEIQGKTMGTTYSIRIVPDSDLQINLDEIQFTLDSILAKIDKQMSTYRLDSEITNFNESLQGEKTKISEGFAAVLKRAIFWGKATEGALDVTVLPVVLAWRQGKANRLDQSLWEPPMDTEIRLAMTKVGFNKINLNQRTLLKAVAGQMIDLNAIAKGWGVDQLFEYFRDSGVQNFMVEIGGEVRTLGKNNKGKSWKIGIDRPMVGSMPGENIFSVVSVSNQAMATSGNYRNFKEFDNAQYSHIIDPRTGVATQSTVASVTVIAPNCMDADALATALNVLDVEEGMALVESLDGFEAFWIVKEYDKFKSVASGGMPIFKN